MWGKRIALRVDYSRSTRVPDSLAKAMSIPVVAGSKEEGDREREPSRAVYESRGCNRAAAKYFHRESGTVQFQARDGTLPKPVFPTAVIPLFLELLVWEPLDRPLLSSSPESQILSPRELEHGLEGF